MNNFRYKWEGFSQSSWKPPVKTETNSTNNDTLRSKTISHRLVKELSWTLLRDVCTCYFSGGGGEGVVGMIKIHPELTIHRYKIKKHAEDVDMLRWKNLKHTSYCRRNGRHVPKLKFPVTSHRAPVFGLSVLVAASAKTYQVKHGYAAAATKKRSFHYQNKTADKWIFVNVMSWFSNYQVIEYWVLSSMYWKATKFFALHIYTYPVNPVTYLGFWKHFFVLLAAKAYP